MEDSLEYWEELLAHAVRDLALEEAMEAPDRQLQKLIVDNIEIYRDKINKLTNG